MKDQYKNNDNTLNSEEKVIKQTDGVNRRSFIKKAVYVAPTLLALGSLTRATDAKADFGPPPSAPDGWN